jgi:hypothetical protein
VYRKRPGLKFALRVSNSLNKMSATKIEWRVSVAGEKPGTEVDQPQWQSNEGKSGEIKDVLERAST